MKSRLAQGFTLVELLIVIALLGVIATIVIAAINPIEQANRAADAGKKADASQIVSAIQRYYASHNVYPWNAASCTTNGGTQCLNGATDGPDDEFPFITADDPSVGICGAAGVACRTTANLGELVASLELQKQFLSKSWVGATTQAQKLLVGKASGASSAVYVCWVPLANSNRQVLIASRTTSNKMVNATGFTVAGVPLAQATVCGTTGDVNWGTTACMECVPE